MEYYLDRILVRDLVLRCFIGDVEDQQQGEQDVMLSLYLYLDLRQAGESDDMQHTVNYKMLRNRILETVQISCFSDIEMLAEKIAEVCLVETIVQYVQVDVDEPIRLSLVRGAVARH